MLQTELRGSHLLDEIEGDRCILRSKFKFLMDRYGSKLHEIAIAGTSASPVSDSAIYELFLRCQDRIETRGFALAGRGPYLAPLADFFNTSADPDRINVELYWEDELHHFSVRTCAPVRKGDQLFLSYDDAMTNAKLLKRYGFVTLSPPLIAPYFATIETVLKLVLHACSASGIKQSVVTEIVESCLADHAGLSITATGQVASSFLTAIARLHARSRADPSEADALAGVTNLCQAVLRGLRAAFPRNLADDEKEIAQGVSDYRRLCALVFRSEQQRVLESAMGWLTSEAGASTIRNILPNKSSSDDSKSKLPNGANSRTSAKRSASQISVEHAPEARAATSTKALPASKRRAGDGKEETAAQLSNDISDADLDAMLRTLG